MIRNVLIVDDDRIWLRVLVKKMAKYRRDFEATPAGDGREALEVLKSKPISLVVTDMQMPQMDGLTLLAHMSEMYPEIPVIVVTAYSTPKLKRAVLERGGAGYIEKPFVVEDLARKIIGMLKKESEGGHSADRTAGYVHSAHRNGAENLHDTGFQQSDLSRRCIVLP